MASRDALLGNFQLAKNCFERMQELVKEWPSTSKACSGDESDYLQFASTASSRRASGGTGGQQQHHHHHQSQSQPTTTARPETPPLKSAPCPYRALPPVSAENANLSLSALRKVHETQLVAKQREKTERVLRARASSLTQNEEYVSNLLQRRQQLYSTVNEKINEVLHSISSRATDIKNTIETERRRKSIKNAVQEINRKGQDFAVIESLLDLLTSKSDPIAILVRDFVRRSRQMLRKAAIETDPTDTLEKVLEEIQVVEYHLIELLRENFEDLRDPGLSLSIKLSIQQFFFSTTLFPAIMLQIRRSCEIQDNEIRDKFIESSWEELFEKLKVSGKMQLPRERTLDAFPIHDPGIYSRAIEELRSVSVMNTPFSKLLCMTRACNSICQAVDERRDSTTIEDEGSLGSEDLLLLTAYVLVRANVPDLASQLTFISKLVPEEVIRGEAGYVLATMQTALEYALGQFSG
jgi:archaellum component FlaC